jgi:integrase/recombinase XerD
MSLTLTDTHAKYVQHLGDIGKSKSTVLAYGKDVEQLVEFVSNKGRLDISEVTSEDIDEFKDGLKKKRYTAKSISRKLNSIKSFFRYLISQNLVQTNPADQIAHPKIESAPPRVLSRTEYRALRDACKSDIRVAAIVEILLQTGIRISELAALATTDIDFDRNVMIIRPIGNAQESRKIPLNKSAKEALMDYLQVRPRAREKTVFLTKTCKPFLVRNIRTAIDRYFRLAGIKDAKVNDLRNTFIVEQLKAGTPLVYVSQLVGHKRITTTEKYLKLIENSSDHEATVAIEEL